MKNACIYFQESQMQQWNFIGKLVKVKIHVKKIKIGLVNCCRLGFKGSLLPDEAHLAER